MTSSNIGVVSSADAGATSFGNRAVHPHVSDLGGGDSRVRDRRPRECGYTEGIKATSVFELVSSDSSGASYVAGWDMPADLTAPFPGYKYDVATDYAYPMKPCATAPASLCEPACNLTPLTDCGLPEP